MSAVTLKENSMNLDIMYFATFEEQKEMIEFLLTTNRMYVYKCGISKNSNDFLIDSFMDELNTFRRPVNYHPSYLFSFTDEIKVSPIWIKGEDETSYSLSPKDNENSFVMKPCSYEQNMILFGRIESVFEVSKVVEAFRDLRAWMRKRYKKKGKFHISENIMNNPEIYRLIAVAAKLQPPELDFKI